MQISPTTPSVTRARAKIKDGVATLALRKPRSRKKSAAPAAEPDVAVVAMHPVPEEVAGLIATTAYYLAAQRNFAPGQELDDWLEAERRIRSDYAG